MDDIKVSVFCLAYNHEKYIRKCLDGFVMQKTSFPFEIIVHDDASTDHTADIIREYEMKYPDIIKPVYQKENQYSKRVNIVEAHILPRVRGKYIASCEGDDYWIDPCKLQKQYDILENNPDCVFCVARIKCCNEDGTDNARTIPEKRFGLDGFTGCIEQDGIARMIWELGGYPFHTSAYFYRAEMLTKQTSLTPYLHRDAGVLRRILLNGKVYYFDEPVSTRRLDSIEGFNARLKKQGTIGNVNMLIEDVTMDLHFDEYTEGRYRSWIIPNTLSRIFNIASYKFPEAKELFSEFIRIDGWKTIMTEISRSGTIKRKNIMKLKCVMMRYMPGLLNLSLTISRKIRGNV